MSQSRRQHSRAGIYYSHYTPKPKPKAKSLMPILISPSILSADFTRLTEQIRLVEEGGADWIHLDVMDGQYVPNITFGPMIVEAVNRITELPLDVHLMIVEPERYIPQFAKAGADWITIHVEATKHVPDTLDLIRDFNCKTGISLNPETSLNDIEPYLSQVDLILVMSVHPGFGGQSFISSSLGKIKTLAQKKIQLGANFLISVDGGVNKKNVRQVIQAGADILAVGSSIFKVSNPQKAINNMRNAGD